MKHILILIAILATIGIVAGQFPWANQDYYGSPYGGYYTSYQGQHYQNPYANVYYLYDSYGMPAGNAGYNHYNNMWQYSTNGAGNLGYINQNPYRYGWGW